MLKTVSSITNAIGALNYKGTWNALTNTPTLVSSVGVKGDYYQVSVAGSTTINGISNWGVGDVIAFNGVVWQRIEGGADLNGVNLSVSGTTTLSGLTASTALALDANKNAVSVTNTGTGNNVLATSPSLVTSINDTNGNELIGITATASAVNELTVANAATGANPVISATGSDTDIGITLTPKGTGNAVLTSGNLVVADGNGIDFSATPGTGTSELLDDYEEGTFTVNYSAATPFTSITHNITSGYYRKIGNLVAVTGRVRTNALSGGAGAVSINLPFTVQSTTSQAAGIGCARGASWAGDFPLMLLATANTTEAGLLFRTSVNSLSFAIDVTDMGTGTNANDCQFQLTYVAA
jgi:hypothetical protein